MRIRHESGRLTRLMLAVGLACALAPAGQAVAAVGSDSIAGAPPLLFSEPGGVDSTEFYGTEPGEPRTGCPADGIPAQLGGTAWWRIAGTGRTITLSTAGSSFDTQLSVFDQGAGAPDDGNKTCNDNDGPSQTSRLTFASLRGRSYLVQVGGTFSNFGSILLTASAPRPANDDRVSAQVLAPNAPATVSNVGAGQERGELQTCATDGYAATIWFRWTAPGIGDAVISSAAAFGTAVTVYRADGTVAGCAAGSAPGVSLRVAAGEDYLVQVGSKGADVAGLGEGAITTTAAFNLDPDVDNDGALASTDCNDSDPTIRPGVADTPDDGIDQNCDGADAINLDRDRDGYNRPGDCNDADPKIHPQAIDVPGNAIDEDCTNGAAPFPRLPSTVRSVYAFAPFHFTALIVLRPVKGSRIVLRCKGGGCFKRRTIKVNKSSTQLSLLRFVKKARLKRGAVVEVRITQSAQVGFMRRITVRGGPRSTNSPPKIEDLCLPVGKGHPKAC
jgi:hypothetical protein